MLDGRTRIEALQKLVAPLVNWYAQNKRDLPWRLQTPDPYRTWVSEIMLQQTRVEAVKPYFTRFMERLPDVRALSQVQQDELLKLWEGLGYYSRAKNLQKAAQIICAKYGGMFPQRYEDVLSLPGIGEYTAGAICSIAFGQPVAAVDGNVLRVLARYLEDDRDILQQSVKKQAKAELEQVYPVGDCTRFTQSLMELGALICLPNTPPKCEICPLQELCLAKRHGTQEKLPVRAPKKARRVEDYTVFLLVCEDSVAVCKRQSEGLLQGLWEYPNVPGSLTVQAAADTLEQQGFAVTQAVGTTHKTHIFTHVQWNLTVHLFLCGEKTGKVEWVDRAKLEKEIALPTAFAKCGGLLTEYLSA